jgi:hypothetical protein
VHKKLTFSRNISWTPTSVCLLPVFHCPKNLFDAWTVSRVNTLTCSCHNVREKGEQFHVIFSINLFSYFWFGPCLVLVHVFAGLRCILRILGILIFLYRSFTKNMKCFMLFHQKIKWTVSSYGRKSLLHFTLLHETVHIFWDSVHTVLLRRGGPHPKKAQDSYQSYTN